MAKGNRGGKLSAQQQLNNYIANGGLFPNQMAQKLGLTPPNPTPTPQPVQNADNVPQSMSATFNSFMSMTDDDKADVIDAMVSQGVPSHLSNTDFQKFIYNIGLNDKPQLVDDATLNAMSGKKMFRTVNSVYDSKNDLGYSATDIAKQIQTGKVTRTSDNGGSVYGRGLYFANDLRSSTAYGNTRGNVKKTAVMSMKLNSNAKVINYYSAYSDMQKEIRSGSKLGKTLSKVDRDSAVSIFALSKGYNVIDATNGYYNVLSRQAITMSKTVNPM